MSGVMRNTILVGDATARLRQLPTGSVDCVVTSPPYFLLRDYGARGQIGLESTVTAWVDSLRTVVREVGRVLKPAGSLWLNLGDSYSRNDAYGAPPKSLLLGPERLVLALVADGWLLRNKTIWAKPNPMPSSVADRLTCTWEVVYHLVRQRQYFYDLDAIRQPHRSRGATTAGTKLGGRPAWAGPLAGSQDGLRRARADGVPGHALGKNPGDVWTVPTRGFRGAHFATFPPALVERPIKATCPEAVCTGCGQPWRRPITVERPDDDRAPIRMAGPLVGCDCGNPLLPGIVLDPFFGTGTVGLVADQLGRDWLGIELNPTYVDLARKRLGGDPTVRYVRAAPALPPTRRDSSETGDDHRKGREEVWPGGRLALRLLLGSGDRQRLDDELERLGVDRRNHLGHSRLHHLARHRAEERAQAQALLLGRGKESSSQVVGCRRRRGKSVGHSQPLQAAHSQGSCVGDERSDSSVVAKEGGEFSWCGHPTSVARLRQSR